MDFSPPGCERKDKSVKLWKLLLLLASLVFTGGVLLLLVNFLVMPSLVHSNKVVTMPDIRGMTVTGAGTSLRSFSLEVEAVRQRAHPSIPQGMILDQIPSPESRIRGGRTVRVVTSSGPPAGSLPMLAGLSLRQAEITLQRENFRMGRVLKIRRKGVTQPVVAYQNPVAGTDLYKGAVVNLVVAEPAAAELLRMPDLRGMPLFQARQAISDAGFILAPVTYERASRSAPNLVLSQRPPAGDRIRKGERLELVASSR
jgi:beta-lactam-binding protein with PASTA domain